MTSSCSVNRVTVVVERRYSINTRIEHVFQPSRGNLLVLTRAFFVNLPHVLNFVREYSTMGYCFFYPTFYSLFHQVSVKLTTVTTIPTTVHCYKTCNDFLRLPDVIVTSQPRLNDSRLTALLLGHERLVWRHCSRAYTSNQWRTQKIFIWVFHSVAYGGHLYLVCGVCDVTS